MKVEHLDNRMDAATSNLAPPPFILDEPVGDRAAVVYASPHSGQYYPPEFVSAANIDLYQLRQTEDGHVDALYAAAPRFGAPLVKACYGRSYLDPNREPYELDPQMFRDPLPNHVNTTSLRVIGGLGTIPRIAANGAQIYREKMGFREADQRVRTLYHPYHQALRHQIQHAKRAHRFCIVVDCHSMPSVGGPLDRDEGTRRPDVVLGDRFSTTCSPKLTELARNVLEKEGFSVGFNAPYAGGFTTYNYGRPNKGVHALQIELNRATYMDENTYERHKCFDEIAHRLSILIEALSQIKAVDLAADY